MIGFLASLGLILGFIGTAIARDFPHVASPGELAAYAVGGVAAAWVLGLIAPKTVGLTAFGWQVGAGLAAVIVVFTGQAAYFLPLLLHFGAAWFVQMGQRTRLAAIY